ncbi:MAG: adenylate/guanylate cyclase domain-containing protein, partial [Nitriliruptorales bacterium]|nr:adenylate/guanylate cyclase domain-containing protein [Nitriliruptorales bacterium]
MQCPSCGHANAADANFCNQCGTALSGGAPPPTAVDDLTRYVPEALLERIRAAQAGHAMRGERRTVTMLFADLEGSTAAAERLDPEEWAEIVNGAFGRLIEPVYRYEGTLARLQGDAILAFFGAPLAHEDDPERAARAGLDILAGIAPYREEIEARYGIPIAVRVGINTGLVVVGEVGSDLRVEYTALGDAINVAARMEQTAQPGTVRVTADTAALLGDPFEVERIGPVEVKGKRDPVIAHRVVGVSDARSDPQAGGELVGRRRELDELEGMVQRVRQGSGGVGTIVGEAGIGKSRLLTALRARAGDTAGVASTWSQDGRIGWLQGRAEAYERSVPHAAFVGLLCRWWDDADRQDDCFGEVARAVAAATGAEDRDLAGLLTHLAGGALPDDQRTLIDSLDTPILHQRTTQAVADYLTAAARRRPLVLVLDDLHWADTLSLALIERLMDLTATEPLVLLLVMRPNQEDPAWRLVETAAHEHADRHTAVELESLDVGATAELLRRLLGGLELDEG